MRFTVSCKFFYTHALLQVLPAQGSGVPHSSRFYGRKSCPRISNPAGYSFSGNSFSGNPFSGNSFLVEDVLSGDWQSCWIFIMKKLILRKFIIRKLILRRKVLWLRKSCPRISNPAGHSFSGKSCSGKWFSEGLTGKNLWNTWHLIKSYVTLSRISRVCLEVVKRPRPSEAICGEQKCLH